MKAGRKLTIESKDREKRRGIVQYENEN